MTTTPTTSRQPQRPKPVEVHFAIVNDHSKDPERQGQMPSTVIIHRMFPGLIQYQQFLSLNLPADLSTEEWHDHGDSFEAIFVLPAGNIQETMRWVKLLNVVPTFTAKGVH